MKKLIPSTLQREEFRFVKVRSREKRAFETGWQHTANYQYNDVELAKHLSSGGNYGVVTNYGNLAILDLDDAKAVALIEPFLPSTFTVKTSKGCHYYFLLRGYAKKVILQMNGHHLGELQAGPTFYVVGPGSIHPSGIKYEVERNVPIAELGYSELIANIKDYLPRDKEDPPVSKEPPSLLKMLHPRYETDLRISDVINPSCLHGKGGGEYQGVHPFHGSDTGHNFSVDTSKNVWYCFRHGVGGGPLELLAMKEGIIRCEDAGRGCLRGEKYLATLKAAGIEPPKTVSPSSIFFDIVKANLRSA